MISTVLPSAPTILAVPGGSDSSTATPMPTWRPCQRSRLATASPRASRFSAISSARMKSGVPTAASTPCLFSRLSSSFVKFWSSAMFGLLVFAYQRPAEDERSRELDDRVGGQQGRHEQFGALIHSPLPRSLILVSSVGPVLDRIRAPSAA